MHYVAIGGSKGLGQAFCRLATERGHVVSILASLPKMSERHYPCNLLFCDEYEGALKDATDASGPVDGVVFCQRNRLNPLWQNEMTVSLNATQGVLYFLTRSPHHLRSVVIVSSVAALSVCKTADVSYHVAKTAQLGLMRYYAATLPYVRVNAVCPGSFVKVENAARYEGTEEGERLARATIRGRMLHADEVAKVILFLLSEEAAGVTGQALVVDGGASLRNAEDLM